MNPNAVFADIENIMAAQKEAKALEKRLKVRDVENEAKKVSEQITATEMSSMMHEWRVY